MHFAIDSVEQGSEEPQEPAQVEDPWVSFYNLILLMKFGCALSYRSWIDTLVALELLFGLSLWILLLEIGRQLWLGVDVVHGRWSSDRKTTERP
jgi:hypothetical protein